MCSLSRVVLRVGVEPTVGREPREGEEPYLPVPGRSVCPLLEKVGAIARAAFGWTAPETVSTACGSANSKALSLVAQGLLILSSDYLVLTYVSIPFYR